MVAAIWSPSMSNRLSPIVFLLAASSIALAAPPAVTPNVRAYANPDLPAEKRIDDLIAALTLDEKIECLSPRPKLPRLGLKLTGHVEGLHGLALGDGSG